MHASCVGLPGRAAGCSRQSRDAPAACSYPARPQRSSRLLARQRQRTVWVAAAARTLYDALGVAQDASERDIKRAYRQKALKLHPDVNKAPDAQEKFMEVKNAFTVLSDPQQRRQYDRKLGGGFSGWGSSGGGFGDFGGWGASSSSGSSSSGAGGRARPQQPEEDFYGLGAFAADVGSWVAQQQRELHALQQGASQLAGKLGDSLGQAVKDGKLEDFFNDLGKEVDAWSQAAAGQAGKPASLWEELAALGEEFVDFLEQGLKDEGASSSSSGGAGKEGSAAGGASSFNSSSSSSSSGGRRSPVDAYEELKRAYDLGGSSSSSGGRSGASSSSTNSSTGGASARQPPPPPAKKSADEEIDDMLAALKRKMNKA